ncbi:MAG: PIG-L deacetylase family protein [Acidimicrobiales bacterium]
MTDRHRETAHGAGPSGLPVGDLPASAPVTLDLDVPAVALAVGAHPDDIEFGSGATLAKWASAGCRVHQVILTDGSKGSWDPDTDLASLVAERRREALAAAAVLDGDRAAGDGRTDRVVFLPWTDGALENGVDQRREMARIIREVRPTVLLGHDPWRRYRLHPDHRNAGYVTVEGLVAARDPHFFPELGLAPHRPDALLLWEADLPNHVERVGGRGQTKIDALLCHRSQFRSTMGIDPDAEQDRATVERDAFAAKVRRQLADHGALAGEASGEAFHLIVDL